jgi:hypothetical protein
VSIRPLYSQNTNEKQESKEDPMEIEKEAEEAL